MTVPVDASADLVEEDASARTALYRLYGQDDELLYVGISDDPLGRMRGHALVQPWWGEVERKTIVWYPHRAQADTAETVAIGLEHPKYNKAKRYVRLPEQEFPADHRQIRRQSQQSPAAIREPAQPRADDDEDGSLYGKDRNPWTGLPTAWPRDMWVHIWWGKADAFPDMMNAFFCPAVDALGATRKRITYLRRRRQVALDPGDYWTDAHAWVQVDDPRIFRGGSRYERTWAAHCISRISNKSLPVHVQELQRQFLYMLHQTRRCASIQLGHHAWAAGFSSQEEAQAAGAILNDIRASLLRALGRTFCAGTAVCFSPLGRKPDGRTLGEGISTESLTVVLPPATVVDIPPKPKDPR